MSTTDVIANAEKLADEMAKTVAVPYVEARDGLLDAVDNFTGTGDDFQADRFEALLTFLRGLDDDGAALAEGIRNYMVKAHLARSFYSSVREQLEGEEQN